MKDGGRVSFSGVNWWSFLILFGVGMILTFLGLEVVGNQAEVFDDYIVETVAYSGSNMSREMKVFWGVLIAGIPGLLALNYWLGKRKEKKQVRKLSTVVALELILGIANIVYLIFCGSIQIVLGLGMIVIFLNYLVNEHRQKEGLVLEILIYYALIGICELLNWRMGEITLNGLVLLLVAAMVGLGLLAMARKREGLLRKVVLICQILVPLGILGYVNERYLYGGEEILISFSMFAREFFGAAIILAIGWGVYVTIKKWNDKECGVNDWLIMPTILVIFVINSVSMSTGMLLPGDLHHTAEEVISYQQIFGKGQEAYTDYSPVSGLFPVFIGVILELIGGNMTEFNIAHAIFMIIMASLTMCALRGHLSKRNCLIAAMLFSFVSYDRAVWILLSFLILFIPDLVRKRNLWLMVWILLILVQGIYYPTFGMAVLIGTLPIGIWQIVKMVKSGELKELMKLKRFYIGWTAILVVILACMPMLVRMAKHIITYSSQTILADGIAVFGQNVPEGFLPYLTGGTLDLLRYAIYYAIRYVIPMVVIWILSAVCVKFWRKRQDGLVPFWLTLGIILTLLFSYSATMVRQDAGVIVSRATYVIVPLFGAVFYAILKKYFEDNIHTTMAIGVVVGVVTLLGCCPITGMGKSVTYATTVADGYTLITEEDKKNKPRLGSGFAKASDLEMLEEQKEKADELLKYDSELKFYGWGKLGVYYILDLTTVGQPSDYAAKDYQTYKEIIDAIKTQKPVVGLKMSDSVLNYYLYNWLMTTDDYMYDGNYEAFLPVELFRKIYGDETEPTSKVEVPFLSTDVGRVADSLGGSMDTLAEIMIKQDIEESISEGKMDLNEHTLNYEVDLLESVEGSDADMLYIDFAVDGWIYDTENEWEKFFAKQHYNDGVYVVVSWGEDEEEQMLAIMGKGNLLIPLGANATWLASEHKMLNITIKNVDSMVEIEDIEFYQLRKE